MDSDLEDQVVSGEEVQEEQLDSHVSPPLELLPQSYRTNSPDEVRLLAIADNFQRQYSHLCPDRKPLLLCPVNECGVKKFVSTSLRPTPTTHCELYTWQGCAAFVADFLSLEPLETPTELPRHLFSSTSVLQNQRGSCVEYAVLLCSLLLGANYDAYCVSGYAVKEMCEADQSLQDCPLLDTEAKSVTSQEKEQEVEFRVKPQTELKSRFLSRQEEKKQEAEAALLQKQKLQQESEQRPADVLRGLRVHCWVLVLSGSRSVQENFFIDPLTGTSYATGCDYFLGIESVWNNFNYYVNMQDCRKGCTDMLFDVEDLKTWEPVLYGGTSRKQLILSILKREESRMMAKITEEEEEEEDEEKLRVFEMPRSWVTYINISEKDLERRWPGGQKLTRYRKAELEKFALRVRPDGLITRLTTFTDLQRSDVAVVKEWFQHRSDHLDTREVNRTENVTAERFTAGRRFHLLFHRFMSLPDGSEREVEFSRARVDDLVKRTVSPGEMTETFAGRRDFLYYRHVCFNQQARDEDERVLKVVERFHRNESKPANEDVAQRVFLVQQGRMEVTYHLMDCRFIPSKRSFIKPKESTGTIKPEQFTPELVSTFQVDPSEKPLGSLALFNILEDLMKDERTVIVQILESEKEMCDIVRCREQEEAEVELQIPEEVSKARREMLEKERLAAEEKSQQDRLKVVDPLAPYLVHYGDVAGLSPEETLQLYHMCLYDFKARIVEQLDLLQDRCEKETEELKEKQRWYEENQRHLSEEQQEQHHNYCSEKTLQISATHKRLHMLQLSVPEKYSSFDQQLRNDPRISPHLAGSD
ncbi:dynein regulatory complex subunit 7 isoform X2 [Mugil cephalus]|uniref:dynein regulatory complex subunit 7 isoform X2 n=1 Tax=Mugil cephalus TaxID=48193 RepID=UPI001FB5C6DE|nr:dynein regulatory complex subunit 7 isoform X2 [Mugil cephalus]